MAKRKKINTRKILDNSFDSSGTDGRKQEFKMDPGFVKAKSIEDQIDFNIIYDLVTGCFKGTEMEHYNTPNEEGKYKKINKAEINKIYHHVITKEPTVSKVEIFAITCEFFDINNKKFYDSLSNTFKLGLIDELEKNNPELGARFGNKLF